MDLFLPPKLTYINKLDNFLYLRSLSLVLSAPHAPLVHPIIMYVSRPASLLAGQPAGENARAHIPARVRIS